MVLAMTASRLAAELAMGAPRLGVMDAAFAVAGTAAAGAYAGQAAHSVTRHTVRTATQATIKAASAIEKGAVALGTAMPPKSYAHGLFEQSKTPSNESR